MPFGREGPPIEALHHHLCEIPPDFLGAAVEPAALAHDTAWMLGAQPDASLPGAIRTAGNTSLVPLCCWLLAEPGLRDLCDFASSAKGVRQLLGVTAIQLARHAKPRQIIDDVDRREELIRLALSDLDMRPAGETEAQAQDRLAAISSMERERIVRAAQAAEARAKEIREALARQAAQEAANKWTRE
ncbi:MAG TPA: hypothetical protein VF472_13725 [Burkholderiaceae bacterium]